jgi:hypothetical protein
MNDPSKRVPFAGANKKLQIKSLDGGPLVEAQYNPKELQVDKTIPWSKKNQSNKSNDHGIHLEFTGGEGRSMSVELLFDGYEENNAINGPGSHPLKKAVKDSIADLETLASVIDPASHDENKRRPHLCMVLWGTGMPKFTCVIESLSTKYTMISSDGSPLRATCTVKLKEADVVSAAKQGGAH